MKKKRASGRIGTVWKFGRKYLPLFLVAEICILISYAISILLPLNLTRLTDRVLYGRQYALLPDVIRSYAVLFAVATAANLLYAFVWQYLNNHYIVDIKNELFRKAICAKAGFLADMNSGDMMSRIDHDSEQFIHVIQRNLFHFVNSLLLCAAIIAMVASIHAAIAAMLTAAALLPIVITRLCGRLTEKFSKESRDLSGKLSGRVFEILKGLRELRLASANWWVSRQILAPLQRLIALGNRTRRVDFFVNKGIYLINLSTSLCIYGFSAYLIMRRELTIGLFLAIIEYIALLHKKFNWMLRIYLDWFARRVSIDRVNAVLEQESEKAEGIEISRIEQVEFRDVSFAYANAVPVLENISFRIAGAARVGLVGASGAGKTTLLSLLLNFYSPQSGGIFVNGIPLQDIHPASLRRLTGVVSQDILLFDETVRYNLCLGARFTDREIWDALDSVALKDLISKMPDGLDTKISSASTNLSGGQKQRMMIARLMLRKARFIILDEATSALDVETEKAVMHSIASSPQQPTLLIISHRLAAIQHCDTIIVLKGQGIEGIGTHTQLLETSPTYRRLFGGERV